MVDLVQGYPAIRVAQHLMERASRSFQLLAHKLRQGIKSPNIVLIPTDCNPAYFIVVFCFFFSVSVFAQIGLIKVEPLLA